MTARSKPLCGRVGCGATGEWIPRIGGVLAIPNLCLCTCCRAKVKTPEDLLPAEMLVPARERSGLLLKTVDWVHCNSVEGRRLRHEARRHAAAEN